MLGPGLSWSGDLMDLKAFGALSNHETKLFEGRLKLKAGKGFAMYFPQSSDEKLPKSPLKVFFIKSFHLDSSPRFIYKNFQKFLQNNYAKFL